MSQPARLGAVAAFVAIVSSLSSIVPGNRVGAAAEPSRGLIYRCRLVATDRGEEITLSLRLRTNEPRGEWRIRIVHERERIVREVRRTDASGDLKVRRIVVDEPRRRDVIGRGRHLATGAVCDARTRV